MTTVTATEKSMILIGKEAKFLLVDHHLGISLLKPLPITLVWNCSKQREIPESPTLRGAEIVYSNRLLIRNAFLKLIEDVANSLVILYVLLDLSFFV